MYFIPMKIQAITRGPNGYTADLSFFEKHIHGDSDVFLGLGGDDWTNLSSLAMTHFLG